MNTPSIEARVRRAPGQRGGPEWKGPRLHLSTRIDPTTAALLRIRAKQSGRSVSEFLADLIRRAVT